MKQTSFKRQVIVLLVVAGAIIAWDLLSGHGGMKSGMASVVVAALTILLLGSMYMGGAHRNEPLSQETLNEAPSPEEMEDAVAMLAQNKERESKAKLN